jgi:hypothetical protein
MRSQLRLAAGLFALALLPRPAGSFLAADHRAHDSVSDFERRGYKCTAGTLADVECRACFPQNDGTQTCDDYFCNAATCDSHRYRAGIPKEVDPARYTLWQVSFAASAASYWLGDFDGDGRRDLAAQVGATVQAALSRGTWFQSVGAYAGPTPVESSGPTGSMDVDQDGVPDPLSISPAHHLVVCITASSGAVTQVEFRDTWCPSNECLIADVNGDGLPDLVDVARAPSAGVVAGDVWVSLGSPLPSLRGDQPAVCPPSIESTAPVTNRASSEARYATAAAISSGSASDISGISFDTSDMSAPSGNFVADVSGVFTPPGASATTRSPRFPYSSARHFVSEITPAFVTE